MIDGLIVRGVRLGGIAWRWITFPFVWEEGPEKPLPTAAITIIEGKKKRRRITRRQSSE